MEVSSSAGAQDGLNLRGHALAGPSQELQSARDCAPDCGVGVAGRPVTCASNKGESSLGPRKERRICCVTDREIGLSFAG